VIKGFGGIGKNAKEESAQRGRNLRQKDREGEEKKRGQKAKVENYSNKNKPLPRTKNDSPTQHRKKKRETRL